MLVFRLLLATLLLWSWQVFANENLPPNLSFEGSEHIALGNTVKLYFYKTDPGNDGFILHMPNGLYLSYGDIVSFGDFYEIEQRPISLAKSTEERSKIFNEAFRSFAYEKKYYAEANKILALLHHEKDIVLTAMQRGEDPEKIYNRLASETNRQLNCLTGGGCEPKTWFMKPGRYLRLANYDFDHFNEHALVAYNVGHELAMRTAIAAHQQNDLKQLEMAYAMNAFASHFLSDRFAAGHIRTPRLELFLGVTPQVTGSILANYMHREENTYGLHVHNNQGTHWIAYGDRAFFAKKNQLNRLLLEEALQASADEVFYAYLYGHAPATSKVMDLVPYADEVNNNGNYDIAPLFYYDAQKKLVMRRVVTADVRDYHWTEKWWGWSTLAQLSKERGIPSELQSLLFNSAEKERAIAEGLIANSST